MRNDLPISLVLGFIISCGGPSVHVQRVDAGQTTDLSGKWNDTDADLTSRALVEQCLTAPWLADFNNAEKRRPVLRVRDIVLKVDEHIDPQVFIKSIERLLLNSGKVRVLAQQGAEQASVVKEQAHGQSGLVSADSAPGVGEELGADFVVVVRMATVLDQTEATRIKLYKINFELIHSTSGEKVWIGDHQIKKLITQDRIRP